jgi:transcription initiation factor TFIID subunit 7
MSKNLEPASEMPVELENQFILRLPAEPAKILREAIRAGAMNLKDRLSIKMEPDMRFGEVRLDHWLLHAKLLDLPSIIESLKTIDNKSFYKTADIGQMLICSTEEDPPAPEEEAPKKKKDPNKVDKKYLWPHGITPPLKNARKRRFRKTLKKKYVEAPEIEKEVKRLLRVDNEAVNVKWEIISEDQLLGPATGEDVDDHDKPKEKEKKSKKHKQSSGRDRSHLESTTHSVDVAEHEIFGEAVSDSDIDDDTNSDDDDDNTRRIDVLNIEDEDESSRLMMSAGEDSRLSVDNSNPSMHHRRSGSSGLVTQFSHEMFAKGNNDSLSSSPVESQSSSRFSMDVKPGGSGMSRDVGREIRMASLRKDLAELRSQREQRLIQQEMPGDSENVALRQRFNEMLDERISAKERELEQIENI